MMSPWDNPCSFFWEIPTLRDGNGHVIKTTRKPAFISAHATTPDSTAEGLIVCVRKMEMTIPPPKPPR